MEADLPKTTEAAFNALLDSLEMQLGSVFVSHTLVYITIGHSGLSEVCSLQGVSIACYSEPYTSKVNK